jgi:Flp pilus assembly protein TadG
MKTATIISRLRGFRDEEDGWALVETILWFPLFFSLFLMIADASVLFMNQARIKKIMQDGSRQLAVGTLGECSDLEDWLRTNVRVIAPNAQANCTEKYNGQATVALARVTLTSNDIDLLGATTFFGGMTVNLSMIYHLEVG